MSQALAGPDRRGRLLFLVAAMMVVALVAASGIRSMASAEGGANGICRSMGFDHGFKLGEDPSGTHSVTYEDSEGVTQTAGSLTVTENEDETGLDWSSTFAVGAVIVKGGPHPAVYEYPGGSMGDTGLTTPLNPHNSKYYELSNVVFCYDELEGGENPQVLQYTVNIAKWVDDAAATTGSFDFTATWTADNLDGGVETSGSFTLDEGTGYATATSPMDEGASYSVVETGIDEVCDEGDAYRLIGYSVGESWEAAAAAAPGSAAAFTDLQADQYVIVHNEGCGDVQPGGNSSITVVKEGLTEGVTATFSHDIPGYDSPFSLTAEDNSITFENLPEGDYTITEEPIEGWTVVSAGCSFADSFGIQEAAPAGSVLVASLGEDEDLVCTFVNAETQEEGNSTITIVKEGLTEGVEANFTHDVPGDSDNFTLDAENNTIVFENVGAGTYQFTEAPIEGWSLVGAGCARADARSSGMMEEPVGNSLSVTVDGEIDVVCTFVNAQAQEIQHTVTVHKYVDGAHATEGEFNFTATWTAANLNNGEEDSGDFTLNETNSFMATTTAMDAGATYSVVENGIDNVCEVGDEYRLLGYSIGDTLEDAETAEIMDAAAIEDLQSDQHIVVHNEACEFGTLVISKVGLEGDAEAVFEHDIPGDSNTFTLTAENSSISFDVPAGDYAITELPIEGWELLTAGCGFGALNVDPAATVLVTVNAGEYIECTFVNQMVDRTVTVAKYLNGEPATTGSFEFTQTVDGVDESFSLNETDGYENVTEEVAGGSSYALVETNVDAVCDEGDAYRLFGYTVGETLEEALAADPTDAVSIESVSSDLYVIAWNQDCGDLGSITIVKNFEPDSDGEVSFTTEGFGVSDFSIGEGPENAITFENLNSGQYTFTEEFAPGWRLWSIFCTGQQSGLDIAINLGAARLGVNLQGGENIVCTFTNREDATTAPGSITIVKDWDSEEAGDPVTFTTSENVGAEGNTFTLNDAEGEDSRTFDNLAPGELYEFTEDELEGWTLDEIFCEGTDLLNIHIDLVTSNLGVDLQTGENVTCTFTNSVDDVEPTTGSLTIVKDWGEGEPGEANFTADLIASEIAFTLPDAEGANSETFDDLAPGTYVVTELPIEGWTLDSIVCEGVEVYSGDTETGALSVELAAGEDAVCTFANSTGDVEPTTGSLTFVKVWEGGDGVPVTFEAGENLGATDNSFTLEDAEGLNSIDFDDLAPDTYTVTELAVEGWTLTGVDCDSGVFEGSIVTGELAIDLEAGNDIVCTFTNTLDVPPTTGDLTIVKVWLGGDGVPVTFDASENLGAIDNMFTLEDAEGLDSASFTELDPGTYSVSEQPVEGWTLESIVCEGIDETAYELNEGGVDVELAAGDDATCTFTNSLDGAVVTGDLTIVKEWVGGTGVETTFTTSTNLGLEGDTFSLIDTEGPDFVEFLGINVGIYEVTEQPLDGWTLTSIECTGPNEVDVTADPATGALSISLREGVVAVCTFTNTLDDVTPGTGELTITKDWGEDAGVPTTFTVSENLAGESDTFVLDEGADTTLFGELGADSYTITETELEGWTLESIVCTEGADVVIDEATGSVTVNLADGEAVACTFTNSLDDVTPALGSLTIVKDWGEDEGVATTFTASANLGAEGDTFTLDVGSESLEFANLGAGTYVVTETAVPGWTLDSILCVGSSEGAAEYDLELGFVSLALEEGQDVTCTFSNSLDDVTPGEPGTITINKVVAPDAAAEGTFSFTTVGTGLNDFGLTTGEGGVPTTSFVTLEADGTYVISETAVDGWVLTGLDCEGDILSTVTEDVNGATVSITLAAGEDIVCTFTNTAAEAVNPFFPEPAGPNPIVNNPNPPVVSPNNPVINPPVVNPETPNVNNPIVNNPGIVSPAPVTNNPNSPAPNQPISSVLGVATPLAPSTGTTDATAGNSNMPLYFAFAVATLLGVGATLGRLALRK